MTTSIFPILAPMAELTTALRELFLPMIKAEVYDESVEFNPERDAYALGIAVRDRLLREFLAHRKNPLGLPSHYLLSIGLIHSRGYAYTDRCDKYINSAQWYERAVALTMTKNRSV